MFDVQQAQSDVPNGRFACQVENGVECRDFTRKFKRARGLERITSSATSKPFPQPGANEISTPQANIHHPRPTINGYMVNTFHGLQSPISVFRRQSSPSYLQALPNRAHRSANLAGALPRLSSAEPRATSQCKADPSEVRSQAARCAVE